MKACYAPFTDVVYRREASGFSVSVWGRTYRYENSLFPVSVKTAGRELLASPMTLHAAFCGEEKPFHDWEYTLLRADGEGAQVAVSAHCGNIMLNATLTFDFDGYVETDLRIVPYWSFVLSGDPEGLSVPKLDGLWFDCETARENASLLHYWPNDKTSIIPLADVVNSGALYSRTFPFKPYLWWGWAEGGMGVSCESEENFRLADPERCIVVEECGETVRLRWQLLEKLPAQWEGRQDTWCDALSPVCYTFGLQATPVKPQPKTRDWVYRRFHLFDVVGSGLPAGTLPETLAAAGTRYVVLHANWSLAENYGLPRDPEAFRATVQRFHALGIRVLVYYGYEFSTILPDWQKKADEYLIKNVQGHLTGGWQARNLRAYMSCYGSSYAEVIEKNILDMMDTYGLDGIYTDGTYVPWECANERHGCGWRDENGGLHPTFPISAVRKLVKRLYGEIHARGGVIETHQSTSILMATLSFADTVYDGENIQPSLEKDPGFLDLAGFQCEYAGLNTGLPMTFIAYTSPRLSMASLAALSLVHNVHPVPRTVPDLEYMAGIWRVFRENGLDEGEFVPYWREDLRTKAEGLVCSEYRLGTDTVVVCANLTPASVPVSLSLPGAAGAVELLSGKPLEGEGGIFRWEAESYRPYLVRFLK